MRILRGNPKPFAVLLAPFFLAGCLDAVNIEPSSVESPPEVDRPLLASFEQTIHGSEPIFFSGSLDASIPSQPHHMLPVVPDWNCRPGQCLEFPIHVDVPHDWWARYDGALEVSILLNRTDVTFDDGRSYHLRLFQEGRVVAEALNQLYATTLLLDEPTSGDYVGLVFAGAGSGPFHGAVQLQSHVPYGATEELPPDLIVLPPTEFTLGSPSCLGSPWVVCMESTPGYSDSCYPDEREAGAERCLRFAMLTGNIGRGLLDMRLDVSQAADALFAEADWIQHIHRGDGTTRDEIVAKGVFEPHHAHMHLHGFVDYRLYEYNLEDLRRGDQVGVGAKVGFCFGDMGIAHLGLGHGANAREAAVQSLRGCVVPEDEEMRLTLSPNWYDVYNRELTFQYVEIGGVPDGVYELVSTVNPHATAIESDFANNRASAVIRLHDDEVTVLHRWSEGLCGLGAACRPTAP